MRLVDPLVFVPYDMIDHKKLRPQDIGIFCYMVRSGNTSGDSFKALYDQFENIGKDAVIHSIDRMRKAGYLHFIRRLRQDTEDFDFRWVLSDHPMSDDEVEKEVDPFAEEEPAVRNIQDHYGAQTYTASKLWKDIKRRRAEIDGGKCAICGSTEGLCAHHKTYERFGIEEMDDLITLCRRCHSSVHKKGHPLCPPTSRPSEVVDRGKYDERLESFSD